MDTASVMVCAVCDGHVQGVHCDASSPSSASEHVVCALLHNSRASVHGDEWVVDDRRLHRRVDDVARLPVTPILCVCFTNHAVDAFLDGLLDRGGVALTDVVRIGSRSKSERMQSRGLLPLSLAMGRSRGENHRYYSLKGEAEVLESEIRKLAGSNSTTGEASFSDIKGWLAESYMPSTHTSLSHPTVGWPVEHCTARTALSHSAHLIINEPVTSVYRTKEAAGVLSTAAHVSQH